MIRFARILSVSLAISAIHGCATWPAQCERRLIGPTVCRCEVVKFAIVPRTDAPAPAGRVLVTCDGAAIPLQVDGAKFDTTRAP